MISFQNCIEKINFILQRKYLEGFENISGFEMNTIIQTFKYLYFYEGNITTQRIIYQILKLLKYIKELTVLPQEDFGIKVLDVSQLGYQQKVIQYHLIKSILLYKSHLSLQPEPISIFISKILHTTPLRIKARLIKMAKIPISLFPWMPEEDKCLSDLVSTHKSQKNSDNKLGWQNIVLQFNIQTSYILRSVKNCKQRWTDKLQFNQNSIDLEKTIHLMLQIQENSYDRWSDIGNIMHSCEKTIQKQYKIYLQNNKEMERMMNSIQKMVPLNDNTVQYQVGEFYLNLVTRSNKMMKNGINIC